MPPFTPALDPFVPREGLSRKHIHPPANKHGCFKKKNGPHGKNTSTLSAITGDEALFHRIPSFSFWCGLLEFLALHWLHFSCNLVANNYWDPWRYPVISSKLLSQNTLQLPPNHHHLQELAPGRGQTPRFDQRWSDTHPPETSTSNNMSLGLGTFLMIDAPGTLIATPWGYISFSERQMIWEWNPAVGGLAHFMASIEKNCQSTNESAFVAFQYHLYHIVLRFLDALYHIVLKFLDA